MFEHKNYGMLTLEELIAEQAKVYKQKNPILIFTGLALSVLIFATIQEIQGFIHYVLPIVFGFVLFKNLQKLNIIKKELDARRSKENFRRD